MNEDIIKNLSEDIVNKIINSKHLLQNIHKQDLSYNPMLKIITYRFYLNDDIELFELCLSHGQYKLDSIDLYYGKMRLNCSKDKLLELSDILESEISLIDQRYNLKYQEYFIHLLKNMFNQ